MNEPNYLVQGTPEDPFVREAAQILNSLLTCVVHNHPNLLHDKNKFKRQFFQHFLPFSKMARETRQEFSGSELVLEIAKNPASWPQVRDAVRDHMVFGFRTSLFALFSTLCAATLWHLSDPQGFSALGPLIWAQLCLWPLLNSVHFLVDWKHVCRWDRMWESSAAARALCPDHPAFHPPRRARKWIAFAHSPKACFDVLGDLDEGFEKLSAEFGFRYARTWYAWNALKSLSASLDALVERLTKWGAIAGFIEVLRHLLAQKS